MSWLSAIGDWLSGHAPTSGTSRSFDPAVFIALCNDDPEEARAMLAADQSALAREIEQTFEVYDARLEELAERVHTLTPAEFRREAKVIREAQDGLRRALRRVEVSAKSARELKRELGEWQDREDESPIHADHPSFRSEIIESELRSRGVSVDSGYLPSRADTQVRPYGHTHVCSPVGTPSEIDMPTEGRGSAAPLPAGNALLMLTHDVATMPRRPMETFVEQEVHEPLTLPEVQHVLTAIREATRETERWHAIPSEDHDEDALLQVHHLRELHALLKRLDREQGIDRDRLEMAVSHRQMH